MFGYNVILRQHPPVWGSLLIFPLAVCIALFCCGILLALQGKDALAGLGMLVTGSFGSLYAVIDALNKTVPLFLCSLGVAVTFQMRIWNIGAEGQFALGAIGATFAALTLHGASAWILLPAMFFCAALAGMIWAFIPAALKLCLSINEIITTLMLNYIGISLLHFLVFGPWKDPGAFGFPYSKEFSKGAIIPSFFDTGLHWGFVLCLFCGVGLWVLLTKTRLGFELKVCGESYAAARYAHIPYPLLVFLSMGLCGALAGLSGFIEVSATAGRLQPSLPVGYGYTAIVVAWVARLSPVRIALVAFFLASLHVGTENLQLEMQVPDAFGSVIEGVLLLTILGGHFFTRYTLRKKTQQDVGYG